MEPEDAPAPCVLTASTLVGAAVFNPQGEHLGTLKEVVFDFGSASVSYAVLSFSDFPGIGEKLFALPWEALSIEPERRRVLLHVTQEELQHAPGFDKNHWPTTPDRRFISDLHAHYGYAPHKET